jgi:hypothetical protein
VIDPQAHPSDLSLLAPLISECEESTSIQV